EDLKHKHKHKSNEKKAKGDIHQDVGRDLHEPPRRREGVRRAQTKPLAFLLPPMHRDDISRMPGLALAGTTIEPPPPASLAGNDAEAVMFDFMQPLAAGGQLIGFGRETRRDEPGPEGTLQHAD